MWELNGGFDEARALEFTPREAAQIAVTLHSRASRVLHMCGFEVYISLFDDHPTMVPQCKE